MQKTRSKRLRLKKQLSIFIPARLILPRGARCSYVSGFVATDDKARYEGNFDVLQSTHTRRQSAMVNCFLWFSIVVNRFLAHRRPRASEAENRPRLAGRHSLPPGRLGTNPGFPDISMKRCADLPRQQRCRGACQPRRSFARRLCCAGFNVAQRPTRGESACLWAGAGGSSGALAVHTVLCTSLESLGWLCAAQGGAVGSLRRAHRELR